MRGPPRGTCRGGISGAIVYKSRLIATCLYSPSPGRATGWQQWDTVSPQATAILRRGIFLVLGVLKSHRNLESHQVTLPSSSSQYTYSQGSAEHRDHRASPNSLLSRFDQRGSSHAMDDHQITCNLKDKAQEGSHTSSNSCYLSPILHLHYKKPCPSLYPVVSNIRRPAHTLPLQDLS